MSNSDEDSSTKQVLEYYKKYSQNPHLQKYFSGTSTTITYAPISDEETPALAINIPRIIITESSTTDISSVKKLQSLEGPSTSKGSSRSVHSSSDAIDIKESQDIVKASTLQRSNSLPSKLCSKEVHFDLSPSENVKILLFGSTSSSDESVDHAQIEKPSSESSSSAKTKSSPIPSTSSSEEDNKIINFGVSLSSLKKKIGLPVAFSTPVFPVLPEPVHVENIYATPKTSSRDYIKSHQTTVLSAVDEEKMSNVCSNTDSNQGNIDQERTKKSSSGEVKIGDTKMSDVSKGAIKKQRKEPIKKTDKESTQEETSVKISNQKVVQLTMSTPVTLDCLYDKNAEEVAIQTEKLDSDSETSEPEGSSCDSFEYISSNLVSLQSSQAQCNVHKKDSSLGKSSGCSVKEISSESSKSRTSDSREDMDKVADLLQVFLSSKRDKVTKNKDYIKKVIKKIMFSSESSQERSSSPSTTDNKASLPRDPVQEKSSKTNTDSTEPDSIVKKQSKSNSNGDYLLQFAENERLYQIAWIDNEISHLSKLKRFLEAKNNSGSEKETKKKASKYKILGKDEKTNKELEREYIIETDQGIPPGANVKYFIDGQKFTVAHCDDSSKVSKSSVIADIAIDSKTSSTNIKVSTICNVCKQIICICKPESLGEPKNIGSLKKSESNKTKPESEYRGKKESEFLPEDFDEKKSNSLEKAFQNCNCTHATNSKCTCPFVEKLAKHFSQSKEMFYTPRPASSVGIQVKERIPVKICKEVQSKVDSLDKQVQYLKSLIQINENNGKSVDKMTNKEHRNGVEDVHKCVSKKSSLKNQKNGDKMIQTNRCKCASKSVQIDNGSLKRLRSDLIDKKIQTEEDLVRGFGVNSTGTVKSSTKSVQIDINDSVNKKIETEKQTSKDIVVPTMFSDKIVNSGTEMFQNRGQSASKNVQIDKDSLLDRFRKNVESNAERFPSKSTNSNGEMLFNNDIKEFGSKALNDEDVKDPSKTGKNGARSLHFNKKIEAIADTVSRSIDNIKEAQNRTDSTTKGDKIIQTERCHVCCSKFVQMDNEVLKRLGSDKKIQTETLVRDFGVNSTRTIKGSSKNVQIGTNNSVDEKIETEKQASKDIGVPTMFSDKMVNSGTQMLQNRGQSASKNVQIDKESLLERFRKNVESNTETLPSKTSNSNGQLLFNNAKKEFDSKALTYEDVKVPFKAEKNGAPSLKFDEKIEAIADSVSRSIDNIKQAQKRTDSTSKGDKILQTDQCHVCCSKFVQIDNEVLKRSGSDSIDRKIQTEEALVREFGVNSSGTVKSSSKSAQIGMNESVDKKIETGKQASKDIGVPTMFSDKMVNSGTQMFQSRCQCCSKFVQIDNEVLRRSGSDSIDRKIQTEEALVREFGVNSSGTVKSSSRNVQIGIDNSINKNIETEKQTSKDTGVPTGFSENMVNSGIQMSQSRCQCASRCVETIKQATEDVGMFSENTVNIGTQISQNRCQCTSRSVETIKQASKDAGVPARSTEKMVTNGTQMIQNSTKSIQINKNSLQKLKSESKDSGTFGKSGESEEKSGSDDETSAVYSQMGSTTVSIPTSILDHGLLTVQSTQKNCACCGRKLTQDEIQASMSKNNQSLCCCKGYNNQTYYTHPLWSCFYHNQAYNNNHYYNTNRAVSQKNKTYCKRCREKLLETVKKQRHGTAYTLILEEKNGGNDEKTDGNKGRFSEEVRVQVPKVERSKKLKDRRNSHEKNRNGSLKKHNGLQDDENKRQYSLKDYLIENRPEFIYSAEYRRQLMLNSRIQREQKKDALKMNFLEDKQHRKDNNVKLYTEKEMKEITKRNYRKLPEVRQKNVDKYGRRLREADKIICDRFAKHVQKSVLKGKANFPIDQNVVNL